MILAVDIGNTRIKGAVFKDDTLIAHYVEQQSTLRQFVSNVLKQHAIANVVVSSVRDIDVESLNSIESKVNLYIIKRQGLFPFTNKYQTPDTLGIDRMVLASGATLGFASCNRLVIDAGTCITYDFIDAEDVYYGGAISPGLRMRYEALHNYTARLPLLETEFPKSIIGNSTSHSIHSGIVNGTVLEIDGFIDLYRAECPNFIIILTGGDADFLATQLKNTIFANSNFLLESLNQTFQYQSQND